MINFDPDKLNYSGLGATDLKKTDFSAEQLESFGFGARVMTFAATNLGSHKFKPKTVFVFIAIFASWVVSMIVSAKYSSEPIGWIFGVLAGTIFGIGSVALIVLAVRAGVQQRLRLLKFISDNHMTYSSEGQIPVGPIMFTDGHSKKVFDEITLSDGVKLSTYKYVTGYGKNAQTHVLDFASVKLARAVPHFYLNGIFNGINATVYEYEVQKLNLEGDFNKYFNLYTPPNYHIDALQIFTPDVMETLMHDGKDYDYELIGTQLFIYAPSGMANSAESLSKLLRNLASVANQLDKQVETYSDTRAGDVSSGKVALEGSTLKAKKYGGAIVTTIVVVLVGYFLLPLLERAFSQGLWGLFSLVATGIIASSIFMYLKSSKGKD